MKTSSTPIPPEGDTQPEICPGETIRQSLSLFRAICRHLSLRDDPCLAGIAPIRRVDLTAADILKAHGHWPHPSPLLGRVPGVEIGDQFIYRTELTLTRLHRPPENGIDYDAVSCLATSIVASGGYPDDYSLTNGVLIYTGMGGISRQRKGEPRDQKMEGGNLALKRSMEAREPVRVIYGIRDLKMATASVFFYDGLYMVEEWRSVVGSNDCFVFEFRLRRIEGQPHCIKLETSIQKMAWRSMHRRRRYATGQRKLLNAKEKSTGEVDRTLAKKSSAPQPSIRNCSRAGYFAVPLGLKREAGELKEKGDDCVSSSREGGGGRKREALAGPVSLCGGG
ncbi:Histone-lysine N-methyltransferase, H3 lysine-9 specific SUVH5 [Platanthera zijinensis]|uniref:Histone-lysine N-methyltransferase, H3 lysine-9 specific SUVH5 n=1 Tax=Platanthera zijinensis TaxID=2320716 RepID=A0AAP0BST8_9ASPA